MVSLSCALDNSISVLEGSCRILLVSEAAKVCTNSRDSGGSSDLALKNSAGVHCRGWPRTVPEAIPGGGGF